jgi:hypothetical protein
MYIVNSKSEKVREKLDLYSLAVGYLVFGVGL